MDAPLRAGAAIAGAASTGAVTENVFMGLIKDYDFPGGRVVLVTTVLREARAGERRGLGAIRMPRC